MRSIWQSLAWKEWHEHKWKLSAILAVIWGMTAFVAFLSMRQRYWIAESFLVSLFLGGIPMAMFVGLGIAAGERSRGTLPFLQALPIPMWRVALTKLTFSLLTVILPVLVTALLVETVRAILFGAGVEAFYPKESVAGWASWGGNWIVGVAGVVSLATGSLVIWAAACGTNRKDEVSAGAVALVVMVAWWFVLISLWLFFLKGTDGLETARLRVVGVASAPLGFFHISAISRDDVGCMLLGFCACIAVHVVLATWYVVRFGRTDDHGIRSPRGAARDLRRSEFLGPPRRFALTAIAWKQSRESGPVAVAGLVAIVAIVTCYCLAAWYVEGIGVNETGFIYRQTATIFGFFIALVAGIGVALQDVGSRLNTFWRSRPIQPDLWFWTKFATGLIIVLASIYVPIGLFAAFGETSLDDTKYPDTLMIAAAQVAVFAAAVMVTCLVRQAVYAAILSIAAVYLGVLVSQLALVAARYTGLIYWDRAFWSEPTRNEIMGGLLTTFFVCAIVAWLAMRNDWGRASRQ